MDEMTLWTIGVVVGLTLLTLLLTGPGMWSEKWGWWWIRRGEKKRPAASPPRGDGSTDGRHP
jgi:hypothetical protein